MTNSDKSATDGYDGYSLDILAFFPKITLQIG